MDMLAGQWQHICQNYSSDDLVHAFQFIQDNALILVEEFYKNMLVEKESAEFFSDDLIQQRLRNTLHQWLLESFSVGIISTIYRLYRNSIPSVMSMPG